MLNKRSINQQWTEINEFVLLYMCTKLCQEFRKRSMQYKLSLPWRNLRWDTSTNYVSRSVAPENNLREDDQTGSHLLPDCHQSTPKGIICTGLGSCNPTPCARLREPLMWPSLLNLGGSWFRVRWLLESRWSQFNYAGTLILKVKVLKNVCYGT